MYVTTDVKLVVISDGLWEGVATSDICAILEIKDHSILITNGIVRREIPKTMLGDFKIAG